MAKLFQGGRYLWLVGCILLALSCVVASRPTLLDSHIESARSLSGSDNSDPLAEDALAHLESGSRSLLQDAEGEGEGEDQGEGEGEGEGEAGEEGEGEGEGDGGDEAGEGAEGEAGSEEKETEGGDEEQGAQDEATGDESGGAEGDQGEEGEESPQPIQTDFKNSDHTDLYTVKRERDRQWELAKHKGAGPEGQGQGQHVPKRPAGSKPPARKTPLAENGKWVEKNGAYVFVSTRGCVNDTCPYTVADDNLKAALDLPSNANDAELLASVMNPSRWKRNSDQAYRDRVCRGSKHEMPRWCKGSAGPGGKYARELDDAEKSWIEQAGRRQESKQTLLVNHKAYLKEAKIQKESMEYTKKALEAQEAVDEATKLALQRVKMEAEVLKQVEQDEADAWHDLVEIRQKVVKYRTLSKEQIAQMEKEEREDEKTKEREQRARERNDRARERAQMEAQQKAKALMVERAKQKARQAQKELERALSIAAKNTVLAGDS